MTSGPRPQRPRAFDRRAFLAVTGGAVTLLGACSLSDPRISGGSINPPPEPSVTPLPVLAGLDAAITTEAALWQVAGLLKSEGARLKLSPATIQLASWAGRDHEAHLLAIRGAKPTDRPTSFPTPDGRFTPRPEPTPTASLPAGDRTAVLRGVGDRLGRAAAAYRSSAAASKGSGALLFGSLAAYASGMAYGLPSDAARPEAPVTPNRPALVLTDAEAVTEAVKQLHALVFGYQAAYPAFRRPEDKGVFDLINARRDQRDRLSAWLRERRLPVPAAEPAYALPVQPVDRARAGELLRGMELAFQPYAGSWLAAATDQPSREAALRALEESVRLTLQWGGPLPQWPGWAG
ncbi:DUF4439 domain-containing protein [Mariniluteicoccus flavus]